MKNSKKILIAMITLLSIALVVFLVFGVPAIKKNKLIKQAESLIAIEKYEEGISIYDNILSQEYSNEIMVKRDAAMELMESDENFKKGLEASEDDDIDKAIKYLSRVPKEDEKRYKKAQEELKNIEEAIVMEVDELIEAEDLDGALKVLNTYLKVGANNTKMKNLKDEIEAKYTEAQKQAKAQEEERKNKETEAIAAAKSAEVSKIKKDEVQSTANNIIGSYKSIISKEANLRDAPTLKSNVLVTLPRGTNVYIYDTQIESADRIWCLVEAEGYLESGWISYNTMNYTIQ